MHIYDYKINCCSLGIITYMLLFNHHLFEKAMAANCRIYWDVYKTKIATFDLDTARISSSAADFIRKLFVANPNERLASDEALGHPWMLYP